MSKYDFKYMVIGSGPAGSACALSLAKAKKSVALVEGRFYGGANLNTRDIPYGVASDFSHNFANLATYPELKNQELTFNFPTIAAKELSTVMEAGGNSKKEFEEAGIVCLSGYANFLDRHTVNINQKKFSAENFILATGAHLKTTEISGIEHVDILTPETAIKVHRLPEVVTVIGGGSTGCEIAEYFAELGVKVLILEMADRLLPREDKEVGDLISDYFIRKLGISVLTNCKVVSVEEDNYSKYLIFRYDNSEKMVRTDSIVLATGSEPFLDYGLENAGVKYDHSGIIANKLYQTSTKHIYAIGDCVTGNDSSTDRAHYEGLCLSYNLINNAKTPLNYRGITRITSTYPEIAVVGYTEDDLIRRDRKYKKAFVKLDEVIASKIHNFEYGFIKLLVDRQNHILGATIVAPNASLIIQEIAFVMRHNLTIVELGSTPHVINSFNEIVKLSAKSLLTKKSK